MDGLKSSIQPIQVIKLDPIKQPGRPVDLTFCDLIQIRSRLLGSLASARVEAGSRFGRAEEAWLPGQPGTVEFRTGLRDALEQSKDVVGAQGVFSLSERDHNGTDRRAQALGKVENGKWVLVTAAK
jgi:hypothetical protein